MKPSCLCLTWSFNWVRSLAVMVVYFNKLNPFKPGKDKVQVRRTWQLWFKVFVATLPLLLVTRFDDWFDTHFHMVSVAIMLIVYGVAFIYLEKRNKAQTIEPTVTELDRNYLIKQHCISGSFPSSWPSTRGLTVPGPTIVGGLLNRTSRSVVTGYLLSRIPVMFRSQPALKILNSSDWRSLDF